MDTVVGLAGTLTAPVSQGFTIKSIQSDVTDSSTTDVLVVLSGSLGTELTVNAVGPVVFDYNFKRDEDIVWSGSGTSLQNVIINYIKRGDQLSWRCGPENVKRPPVNKWKVS